MFIVIRLAIIDSFCDLRLTEILFLGRYDGGMEAIARLKKESKDSGG